MEDPPLHELQERLISGALDDSADQSPGVAAVRPTLSRNRDQRVILENTERGDHLLEPLVALFFAKPVERLGPYFAFVVMANSR